MFQLLLAAIAAGLAMLLPHDVKIALGLLIIAKGLEWALL